jgi:MFS family permease
MVSNTVPSEDLLNAVALNSFAFNSMRIVGPAVAGGLIALSGPTVNFGIQSAAYVAAFVFVLPLRLRFGGAMSRRAHSSFLESFRGGIRYVSRQPTVLGLILLALVPALFTTPINIGLVPVFARDALGVDAEGVGFLFSVQGIGAVIGTLAIASLSNLDRKGIVLSAAAFGLGFSILCYSQVTVFWLALPFMAMTTCSFFVYSTINQTIIQTITPDEFRGRVMGLHMMDNGLSPLGSLIFGGIAEAYSVSLAIFIAGVCALSFVVLILVRFPTIRDYQSHTAMEEGDGRILTRPAT